MPNYDYRCDQCGHAFESFQTMSDAPLRKCPQCRGPVKRLLGSGSGILFKGTGFYETDYRRKTEPAKEKGADAGSKDKKPAADASKTGPKEKK